MNTEILPLSEGIIDRMVGHAGEILEKRYPGDKVASQMIKSPDVMFLEGLALAVVTVSIVPIETIIIILKELLSRIRRISDSPPPKSQHPK